MSAKKYKTGVIGFAHMHVNGLIDCFDELDNIEWVACADTKPVTPSISEEPATRKANLERALNETGIPVKYDDYREMLEKEDFDIIIFCPENARHAEVAEAVAEKGIDMLTEKPMAHNLSDALRMVRAARHNKVELMINWPSTWSPVIRKTKELLDEKVIGEVWEVKYRNGSMGPLAYGQDITDAEKGAEWWHQKETGGGALLDYCCYGACISRWYLGEPAQAAQGLKANFLSHYGDAEDNAVINVRFKDAVAILEGTWSTYNQGIPTGPIIYGSKGTIVASRFDNSIEIYKEKGTREPTRVVEGDPIPEHRDNPAKEFIHHLETGDPLHPTLDLEVNVGAMAILDAGIRSAASGKLEMVNNSCWNIG
ncbi:MAG: Gfo/Idh/MocA family protein [Bacillota bacterium]